MNESRLKTILTVLPVLSAGLYLMGATYHQGYLETFGLDESQFPLATDRSLLSGFIALISFGLVPMFYATVATVVLVFTVMVAAVLASHPKVKHWQTVVLTKLSKLHSKDTPSAAMGDLVDKSAIAYGYSVGILLVILSLLMVAFFSGKSGKEQATKEVDTFKAKSGNYAMLYSPLLPAPVRVKQITCSQTHCAFWFGNESVVLKHENVERVVFRNPIFEDKARGKSAPATAPEN